MTYYRKKECNCPHCGATARVTYYHVGYGFWTCDNCHRTGHASDFSNRGFDAKEGKFQIIKHTLTLRKLTVPYKGHKYGSTKTLIRYDGSEEHFHGPFFRDVEEAREWCLDQDIELVN